MIGKTKIVVQRLTWLVILVFSQSACSDSGDSGNYPDADQFTVSVVGQGSVNAAPDQVIINASLRLQGEQSQPLLQKTNSTMAQVLKALKKHGVKEKHIQAGQLRLSQRWQHRSGKQEPNGYEAVRSLHIALKDIEDYPRIIDLLFAQGVNTLNSVEFGFSKQSQLMDQAVQLAAKDAIRQANLLGESMGGKACRPQQVSRGGAVMPMPRLEMAALRSHDAGQAYNPGEQAISAQVNAVFSCRL